MEKKKYSKDTVPSSVKIDKIKNNITSNQDKPFNILVLSGALSPVHKMHVECLEICKKYLESNGYNKVVGGFICPSSDSYVKSKLGNNAIILDDRNYLSELAVADNSWIDVMTSGMANATFIMTVVQDHLEKNIPTHQFQVWLVVGSDHGLRHELYRHSSQKVLCVYRPGEGDQLNEIISKSTNKNKNFYMVEFEGQDLSSTLIRNLMRNNEWEKLDSLLHPDVVKELKKRKQTIFLGS